jgi:hypothetical protein
MSRQGSWSSPISTSPRARRWVRVVGSTLASAVLLLGTSAAALATTPRTGQFQVNTLTYSSQEKPAVAHDAAGNFVVVWQSSASAGNDSDGLSVQARFITADGTPVGTEFQVNTSTANRQEAPAVAMTPTGDFVVAWESNHSATTGFDIMAQRFNAAGAKVGPELLVNSAYTSGDQVAPAVAIADNGDFVVVWRSPGGAGGDSGVSIQGRRFSAASGSFLNQFLVNNVTSGDQDEPAIATDGKLTYLAAWRDPATSNDIAIRYFTADDHVAEGVTANGPQETANTYPSGSQTAPSVAMASDGSAIVGWESFGATFGNDTSRISIQARRLDPTGAFTDGNDVQINTYTNDDQRYVSVTIAPDGTCALAWQSYGSAGNDNSDYSIQLRAFKGSGAVIDSSDVQANTYTSGEQSYPSAALAPNGRMLVVWESNGSSGSDTNGYSIQGRLFNVFTPVSDPTAIPAAARVQGSGAFFTSRINLYSAGTAARQVAVTYTPRADIGGSPRTAMVPLPAGGQLEVDDPLAAWFGFSGGNAAVGSLLLELRDMSGAPVASGELLAQSVVFARKSDGSEFGQFFPALRSTDALTAGQTGYLASTVNAQVYRVNVGLMGLADGTHVTVTPMDRIGSALATGKSYDLNNGANQQLNNIFTTFKISPRDNILIAVQVTAGKALAYASILDGNIVYTGTSDPTTILPVTAGAQEVTLLELGPVQGLNEFTGSASITNFSTGTTQVRADFYARSKPGVDATTTFTIPGGSTVGYEDIVGDLFGLQGVGTVRLTTLNGTLISASGREYAVFRDTHGTVIGTAGQLIPGMLPGELLQAGVRYHLLGLREFQDQNGRERSNIAAFNPGTSSVTLTVELHDGATGQLEGQTQLVVRGGELVQTNSIITAIKSSQNGNVKRLEITSTGPLYVRAFRVNRFGDPITIPPQRVN